MKLINNTIPALILLLASCKGAAPDLAWVWVASTFAGSGTADFLDHNIGTSAHFNKPASIAVGPKDDNGNFDIYVADQDNHRIRKIAVNSSGSVTGVDTLAGSGTADFLDHNNGTAAQFNKPTGIAVGPRGDNGNFDIYVADRDNHRIRKIEVNSLGSVTGVGTLAGSGKAGFLDHNNGTSAQFKFPTGIAVGPRDDNGNFNIYVADRDNHRIRKIEVDSLGSVTEVGTLAGSEMRGFENGTKTAAQFNYPAGVAADTSSGNVYVADEWNHRIRKITSAGRVSTFAGTDRGHRDGAGNAAQFYYPHGVAVDSSGNVYVADTYNNRIRKITSGGVVSTLSGSGRAGFANGTSAQFDYPHSVAMDSLGNIYVADFRNHRIRKLEYKVP